MRLADAPLAVLDTETTGLRPSDRVIEIAVIQALGDRDQGSWSSLCAPGMPLPPRIPEITGITDADLAKAETFDAVSGDVLARVADRVLVAYNAEFDRSMIMSEFERCGLRGALTGYRWLCPATLARIACLDRKYAKNYKLSEVATRLKLEWPAAAHRALADTTMTLAVLRKLQAWLPEDLDEIFRLQWLWRERQEWIYAQNRDGYGDTTWRVGALSGHTDTRHGAYVAAVLAVRRQSGTIGWHQVKYSGGGADYADEVLGFLRPDGAFSAL